MKTKILTFFILTAFTFPSNLGAQPVVGFWEVTSVKVGDRTMTPVAKWFKTNKDGTFQSGNGWTQNSVGTWTYDEVTMEYHPLNTNGIKDEFGAFQVSFSNNHMIWQREEEGMMVIVNLAAIDKMPMAPADRVTGLWKLIKVEEEGENIIKSVDPNGQQFAHFRPDKRYRLRLPDNSFTQGYWHMDGHNPEFTLISYNRQEENLSFRVSFEQDQLIMRQNGSKKMTYTYNRIDQFPE